MYWFNVKRSMFFALSGSVLLLSACRPESKATGAQLKYFDIKGYFINDTARLNKLNKLVFKTVAHNGLTESKNVRIDNWGRELDLFIGADINKPAWKDSYTIVNNDSSLLFYKAKYPELHVREILIKLDKQKVKWMLIYTRTKNILYQTTEKLTYYPDSVYIIEKYQKVKLMKNNSYKVQGEIGH